MSNVDGTGSGCFDVRYSVSFPFKSARRGCSGFFSLLVPSLVRGLTCAFIGKVKDRDDILIKARFHTTDSKLGTRGKEGIDGAACEGLSKTHLARGKGTH